MRLTFSASPPTFALILAAPSWAFVPSNIFIFAPVKDDSLHATPNRTSRPTEPIALQPFSRESGLGIGRFLSVEEYSHTTLRGKEYIPGEGRAEPQGGRWQWCSFV